MLMLVNSNIQSNKSLSNQSGTPFRLIDKAFPHSILWNVKDETAYYFNMTIRVCIIGLVNFVIMQILVQKSSLKYSLPSDLIIYHMVKKGGCSIAPDNTLILLRVTGYKYYLLELQQPRIYERVRKKNQHLS